MQILLKIKLLVREDGKEDEESITPMTVVKLFHGYKK